jgi:hypothetical protein
MDLRGSRHPVKGLSLNINSFRKVNVKQSRLRHRAGSYLLVINLLGRTRL